MNAPTSIADSTKIEILMKEYETLRTEILQRLSSRFAFLALFGAVGGYAFFQIDSLSSFQVAVLFCVTLLLFIVWLELGFLVRKCSVRIAEIELKVNELAGEKLLCWESDRRGSKLFHSVHRFGM